MTTDRFTKKHQVLERLENAKRAIDEFEAISFTYLDPAAKRDELYLELAAVANLIKKLEAK